MQTWLARQTFRQSIDQGETILLLLERLNTDPSEKISGSTAVQCYCPATGQSLGLVNPVTPDGIDRIVAKATKAQKTWAKSTFAERRQVLKSLLKYVHL